MNISIQVYGLLVLILLYVFYKSHKTLGLYTEKVFCMAMYFTVISLSLDTLSVIFIHFMDYLPLTLVRIVCRLYVISLVWEAIFALGYVLTDVFPEKKHRRRTRQLAFVALIQSVIIIILPMDIFRTATQTYTYGPAVVCVYFFALLYILFIIGICIFNRKLNSRRSFAMGLWMFIWIAAAIIQYLNNELLVVGFASAVGVLILFVIMENPEANLDRKLGCFNSYALSEYLLQLAERKKKFSLLEISFDSMDAIQSEGSLIDSMMLKAVTLASKHSEVYIFRNFNSELVIIGENTESLYAVGDEILKNFYDNAEFRKNGNAVIVLRGEIFSNMDEMLRFMTFIRNEYTFDSRALFVANEDIILRYTENHIIEKEISSALADDRVEVFLQPIYSNNDGMFTSAEALARIRLRDGMLLSPGVFIPIAEDSGQILEIGERVFEKVCEFIKTTDVISLGIHYIEVNLSVVQCEMENLADRMISIIEKHGVDPRFINLEITETASVTARNTLLKNMNRLIDYGFTFSLDDFGKGQSNLMYVVEMPVSLIKLDYDMSKAFFNSSKAKQVVRAVVEMAHGMDLKLVAEGIETKKEIEGMYEEKVDYIQGFYYSKPLPMLDFLNFLKR